MLEPPTLELPTPTGSPYQADPEGACTRPGILVTVTATLDDEGVGVAGDDAAGVDQTGFDDSDLEVDVRRCGLYPGGSADPVATQASCTDGAVTVPTIEPVPAPGVLDASTRQVPYDPGSDGLHGDSDGDVGRRPAWGDLPEEWTDHTPTTATSTVNLIGTTCDVVTPVAPTVTQPRVPRRVSEPPTLTKSTTDGITYTTDADPALRAFADGRGDRHAGRCRGRLARPATDGWTETDANDSASR